LLSEEDESNNSPKALAAKAFKEKSDEEMKMEDYREFYMCEENEDIEQTTVMKGDIRVRRKLFFYKPRKMVLLDDGRVIL
jgi:hypothetical protein